MNRVFFALVAFGVALSSHAEIVTVPFNGTASRVIGAPYGIQAEAGVTHVTGSFQYDTAMQPVEAAGNTARFMATINNGFRIDVAGVSLMSSTYFVLTQNNSPYDILGANAGRFFHYSSGLAVNGIPVDGAAEMNLEERGDTLFSSNDDLRMLPSQNRIGQLDFDYYSLLQDHQGNFLYFRTRVPEPGAIILAAQLLCLIALRGRRRSANEAA